MFPSFPELDPPGDRLGLLFSTRPCTGSEDPADELLAELRAACERFQSAVAPLRTLRNKYLAHFDRSVFAGSDDSLRIPTAEEVNAMVEMAAATLNVVRLHYLRNHMYYCDTQSISDADALVVYLSAGVLYNDLERDQTICWTHRDRDRYKGA